jgi:hypothetical protein
MPRQAKDPSAPPRKPTRRSSRQTSLPPSEPADSAPTSGGLQVVSELKALQPQDVLAPVPKKKRGRKPKSDKIVSKIRLSSLV